ncbi:MAG: GAF domain-containing protein [Bryobacteraceae bacterium]|jgi:GAF domain-containing protein
MPESRISGEELRSQDVAKALQRLSAELLRAPTVNETLSMAVEAARALLAADFCSIVLRNKADDTLVVAAASGWPDSQVGYSLESGAQSHTGYTVAVGEPVVVLDFAQERRFLSPSLARERGIRSGLSVPIFIGGSVVGAMLVHTLQPRNFTEADCDLLGLIANQTAIAMESAERYENLQRKNVHLRALLDAARVMTQVDLSVRRKHVLDQIVQQAIRCVGSGQREGTVRAALSLYNESTNKLRFESASIPEVVAKSVDLGPPSRGDIGIGLSAAGRAVITRQPQIVTDLAKDADYLALSQNARSEVSVPLLYADQLVGVLSVESDEREAFDKDDLITLQALAEMAAITIRNVSQFEELKATKGLVGARTALAWMGMASNVWRHAISTQAATIAGHTHLIRLRAQQSQETIPSWLEESLKKIAVLSARITENPITPPLSSEQGVSDVHVNAFVSERLAHLIDRFEGNVRIEMELTLDAPVTVRASPEWLRRALEVLIENAQQELMHVEESRRLIRVLTRPAERGVEIVVRDLGRGIPPDVAAQVFKGLVKKQEESRGLGMGLLMAQAIVEAYGGKVYIEATGSEGTSIVLWLPIPLPPVRFVVIGTSTTDDPWHATLGRAVASLGELLSLSSAGDLSRVPTQGRIIFILDSAMMADLSALLSRIRTEFPDHPVVVVMASPTWHQARTAFISGATDCIRRSSSVSDLERTLSALVRRMP